MVTYIVKYLARIEAACTWAIAVCVLSLQIMVTYIVTVKDNGSLYRNYD